MSDSQADPAASIRPPAIAAGNVAVITGGASGIGLAVAEAMIAEGMKVLLAEVPKLYAEFRPEIVREKDGKTAGNGSPRAPAARPSRPWCATPRSSPR